MIFKDLPLEIHSRIIELCPLSDLAVLSRVHTSGRDIAEDALYSRIQYCVRPSDLITGSWDELELKQDGSLLRTLTNYSQKALMVKIFYVELLDEYDEEDAFHEACSMKANFILVKLAEALVKTSNLVDLRIQHGQWMNDFDDSIDVFKGTRRISEVIRGDYFKLHTLYLRYNRYLEEIVANQSHLRVLGILSDDRVPRIKELYQCLSRCRTMSTAIALADTLWPTITVFPALHHPGEALRACRGVATSLANCDGFFGQNIYQLSVSLLGTSRENISLVSEVMEAMATCLQGYYPRDSYYSTNFSIVIYKKSIQKPWRFPEFIRSIALFEVVTTLRFAYPEIDFQMNLHMATDLESCMVEENLGRAWPNLQEIKFFCFKRPNLLMSRKSNWNVIECTSKQEVYDHVEGRWF